MSDTAAKFYAWAMKGLEQLTGWVDEHDGNHEALAWLLDQHRRLADEVKAGDAVITAAVVKAAPELRKGQRPPVVEGVGVVKVTPAATAKRYDQGRIVAIAAARIADLAVQDLTNPDDGTLPPVAELIAYACNAMADLTGATTPSFTGWRAAAATKLGMPPLGDLRETVTTGTPKVVIS